MLTLWKSILSIEKISIYDNFFDIGGDSLCALKLQLELMKAGYNVNYGDIFKHNTIAELASFMAKMLVLSFLHIIKEILERLILLSEKILLSLV